MTCRSCKSRYTSDDFAHLINDYLEDQLANVSCNRL
ncbi:hypothetical protein [Desulfatiferula olefinivorans]